VLSFNTHPMLDGPLVHVRPLDVSPLRQFALGRLAPNTFPSHSSLYILSFIIVNLYLQLLLKHTIIMILLIQLKLMHQGQNVQGRTESCSASSHFHINILYIQCESKPPPPRGPDIFSFFHKRLRICNRFFTLLLNVPIFARLQIFI